MRHIWVFCLIVLAWSGPAFSQTPTAAEQGAAPTAGPEPVTPSTVPAARLPDGQGRQAAPQSVTPAPAQEGAYESGLKHYAAKEYARAAADFEEAAKADPGSAAKLYFTGYAYYKSGQMEKAVGFFDRAYAADPNFSPMPPPAPKP